MDIASVVLSSVSLSTWSGRLKEEASAFLQDAHQKMCVSFLCLVPSLVSGVVCVTNLVACLSSALHISALEVYGFIL